MAFGCFWPFYFAAANESPNTVALACSAEKSISATDDFCHWCMRDLTSPLAEEMADIDAMLRQLNRFEQQKYYRNRNDREFEAAGEKYREQLLNPQSQLVATVVTESVADKFSIAHRKKFLSKNRNRQVTFRSYKLRLLLLSRKQSAIIPTRRQVCRQAGCADRRRPLPPPVPRKSWAEILGGFLAERNIRWTELIGVLVGGLLMVGCSIALVIAFWSQLESIPALKFLVFVGYSSAVFAAGLFVFHRWKLESTGRGLMVIATLLVPLNFLAMASFYKEQWGLQTWAMESDIAWLFLPGWCRWPPRC